VDRIRIAALARFSHRSTFTPTTRSSSAEGEACRQTGPYGKQALLEGVTGVVGDEGTSLPLWRSDLRCAQGPDGWHGAMPELQRAS
jgi:hypothetical protein